jgi:hypothetical protein
MIIGASLILKRVSASRPSGEWNDDEYDVVADGVVVGRIMEGRRLARRNAMAVDARLRASRGPQRRHTAARGRDGGVQEKQAF